MLSANLAVRRHDKSILSSAKRFPHFLYFGVLGNLRKDNAVRLLLLFLQTDTAQVCTISETKYRKVTKRKGWVKVPPRDHPSSTWCIRPSSLPARPNTSNVAYCRSTDYYKKGACISCLFHLSISEAQCQTQFHKLDTYNNYYIISSSLVKVFKK